MKIAIIGAGPRGILIAERSLHDFPDAEIQVFDQFEIGGQTWQTDKQPTLIMNTPAEQVQQFDWTFNLYEWCTTTAKSFIENQSEISNDLLDDLVGLKHNSYPTRRIYAAYLQYCYQSIPNYNRIKLNRFNIDKVTPQNNQYELSFNGDVDTFDKVVITIDNGNNSLSDSEKELKDASEKMNLNYFTPTNHLKDDFMDNLSANKTVIIRGLGLNFYDILSQFIDRWNGNFFRDSNGQLHYQPSGEEQHLVIGSHRGLPHYPRPVNQDGPISDYKAMFLSVSNIINYSNEHSVTKYQAFIQLVKLEVEYYYYSTLVQSRHDIDLKNFQAKVIEEQAIPDLFDDNEKLNWQYLLNPIVDGPNTDYRKNMLDWFELVTKDAKLGSKDAKLLASFNVIRGLYNTIRDIYTDSRISDDDFKFNFFTKFNNAYVFLISGAPGFRLERLLALIKANVVDMLAPSMQIKCESNAFLASSKIMPNIIFKSDYLIEARQPAVNLSRSKNPLIKNLIENDLLSELKVKFGDQLVSLSGSRINIDYQLINKDGNVAKNLYMFSQINVGERWLTNVCPRSGNDYNRQAAKMIVAGFNKH